MGHKVNPNGLRLGYNKNWLSQWFSANQYANNLQTDYAIRELIMKKHKRSGIANIIINRNRAEIIVAIISSKPGVLIGRSGVGTQDLKLSIEKTIRRLDAQAENVNVRLNIVELKNPEINARLVAEGIANQIERRISPKRAMRQAMEKATEKKAKGIKIRISGRLGGAEIARSEVTSTGSIPLQTMKSNIDYSQVEAHTTYGVVGVKVWIYSGELTEMPLENTPESTRHTKNK